LIILIILQTYLFSCFLQKLVNIKLLFIILLLLFKNYYYIYIYYLILIIQQIYIYIYIIGGFGINLTSANVVIIYDLDFNPHNDKQVSLDIYI